MVDVRTYVILLFILTLLGFVTGHNDIAQKFQGSFSGPKIVGGRDASPNERPFQVTIQWEGNNGHWCGGTIIDSEHVLTAGHCVNGLSPAKLLVFAGVLNNTKESSEDTKVVRQVTKIFLHEGFVRKPLNNDIAVLKVSPAFPTENPAVKTISLRKDVAPDGVKCTVSGWGRTGLPENPLPQILQVAVVHFMTYEECRSKYRDYTDGSIEPGMICVDYFQGEQGACKGDSGGPLQCEGILTGVVSWGVGCPSADYPDVYTDVAYYKDWIERQIRKGKEEL